MIGRMGLPGRKGSAWVITLALLALGPTTGCDDPKQKMEARQRQRDAEKKKAEEAKEAKLKAEAPKVQRAVLDAPWADPDYLQVATGTKCPEGLWALFPETPGEGAEKQANEAKRAELAARVKGATFVAVLPLGGAVAIGPWDAKKKTLPVKVDGVIECFDGLGLLSVAINEPAKPLRPKRSEEVMLTPQAVWRAPALVIPVPFGTAAEAKAFVNGEGTGLEARVVFTPRRVEVDKKLRKPPKPEEGAPVVSDAPVDWGAGRLVHAELVGVRLGVDHEKVEVAVDLRR
jgi:hypothetical protein